MSKFYCIMRNRVLLLETLKIGPAPSHGSHISQIAQQRWTYVVYRWLNTGTVERCLQRLSIQEPLLYIGAPSCGVDGILERHLVKIISTTFFVSILYFLYL